MAQTTKPAKQTLKIEYLSTSALIPDPRNARKHSKKQISRLAAAFQEFGFTNPILTDERLRIIGGHARLDAAKIAGLATVPCIRIEGLSDAQQKALAIADNKLGDMSSFDADMLTTLLLELESLDFDVELTGFDTAEVDILIEGIGAAAVKADPADAELMADPGPVVTQIGDIWQMDKHRLLCGNALDAGCYEALPGSERADLIFSDPPYNVPMEGHASGLGKTRHREFSMASGELSSAEFTQFLATAMSLMVKFSKDGSIHYLCMDHRHAGEILTAGSSAYTEYKNLCVWDKGSGGMGSLYRSQHELIFVFKNGKASHVNNVQLGSFGRYRTNVWSYPGLNSFAKGRDEALASHPTVKPVALVADAIRDCSRRGELVLDPFAGSGTTIIAAERTKRRAAAMEIDPIYVDTAVRRWQTLTGKTAVLASSGRSFAEVAADRAPVEPAVSEEDSQ